MKIVIEAEGTRRFVNTGFRVYGSAEDLKIIAKCILAALHQKLAIGWVEIGEELEEETTPFPFEPTANEKPTYPWGK